MGINGVNQQNYNYYNRGVNNNLTLTNSYANTPIFTGVNQTNIDSFKNSQAVTTKDGKDDGSIGSFGAVGNLFKGVGNFFKGMVCDESGKFSWTRTLTTIGIGAAIGVACTMLPAITIAGTAFSTLGLISAGFLGFAGLHAGSAAIDIMSAKTDAEAEQAWQSMGSALTEGGLAYLGYRASGGIFAKDVVPTTPSGSTPKTPKTEPTIEPPKAETVVETKPIVSEAPIVKTITEEPVTTTSVAEPIAKPVEKPAMTMTYEARVQYNKTKAQIENNRPKVNAKMIDEQFATPGQLTEMKEFYAKSEIDAKIKSESVVEEHIQSLQETKTVKNSIDQNLDLNEYEQLLLRAGDKPVETPYFKDYMQDNIIKSFEEYIKTYGENLYLRRGYKPGELTLEMDEGFRQAPTLERDATVYRGLEKLSLKDSQEFLDTFKEGAIIEDKGFMSTSISLKHIKNTIFIDKAMKHNGIIMRIHLPKGTKGVKLDYEEFLLPRNSKIKINSIQEVDGVKVADCEYLLPE